MWQIVKWLSIQALMFKMCLCLKCVYVCMYMLITKLVAKLNDILNLCTPIYTI